jgi:hypothetical protein
VFVPRPFDAAHGEATTAFKLKRAAITAHFSHVLAAAAAAEPPSWMAVVQTGRESDRTPSTGHDQQGRHPLAAAVWLFIVTAMIGCLESLKAAHPLPIGDGAIERTDLDAGGVHEVVDNIVTKNAAGVCAVVESVDGERLHHRARKRC